MGGVLLHRWILLGIRTAVNLDVEFSPCIMAWVLGDSMNIRRGLFRLWVVLTGLWLVFVAAIHFDEVVSPYFTPIAYYFPKDTLKAEAQAELDRRAAGSTSGWGTFEIKTPEGFLYSMAGSNTTDAYRRLINAEREATYVKSPVKVEKYTKAYENLDEAMIMGKVDFITMDGLPEVALFVGQNVADSEKKRQAAEAYHLGLEVKNAYVSKKRWEAIPRMALSAVIPPAVLLSLGWLVLWIVRGFRTAQ